MSNEQKIWSFLFGKIGNAYGVAELMGNLNAESGLRPNNLQNTYEKSLGMSDDKYTAAIQILQRIVLAMVLRSGLITLVRLHCLPMLSL